MKPKKLIFFSLFTFLVLSTTLLIFIILSRQHFCGYACYKKSKPAPYSNATYFSTEFLAESNRFPSVEMDNNGMPYYPLYQSRYFNIQNGHRITKFNPSFINQKIYIVGGSAALGLEVPDEWTIASQLQLLLKDSATVLNYGYAGITSKEEFKIISNLKLNKNDIVIIFDGVNDALMLFFSADNIHNPSDNDAEMKFISSLRPLEMLFLKNINYIRMSLLKIDFFKQWIGDEPTFIFQKFIPRFLKSQYLINKTTNQLLENFLQQIIMTDQSITHKKAHFVHAFQPYLKKENTNSEYQRTLIENATIYPPSVRIVLDNSYMIYELIEKKFNNKSISFINLQNSLNRSTGKAEYFLDFCHLNHEGNIKIANEFFKYLIKKKLIYKK